MKQNNKRVDEVPTSEVGKKPTTWTEFEFHVPFA